MKTALATLTLAVALAASGPALANTQMERAVRFVLIEYGFSEVDPASLSVSQQAAILDIAGDSNDHNKRALIRSAIGGKNTLRSLIFN